MLKTIDINAKSFTANGKEYFIEKQISFDRFQMYQKLQIECAYDVGFYGLYKRLQEIYKLCNEMKFADIAVLAHNSINGIKSVDEREIPVLTMCALFINTADEDRRFISDALVEQKIKDWREEGLDIGPFFQLATASINGFLRVWSDSIRDISELQENQKNKQKTT